MPILELDDVGKRYGNVHALRGVNITVRTGEVTCVLGDNGAGKSTLIKIVAGLHAHTEGVMKLDGDETSFSSPASRPASGIATVYQDLALAPLMSVWRNFFLGYEIDARASASDIKEMKRIADAELPKMGIVMPDLDQPVSALSGGQRQVIAIARAIYFGAHVVILDEPTAALGVKQSGVVLKYILKMRVTPASGSSSSPTTRTTPTSWATTSSSSSSAEAVLDKKRDEVALDAADRQMAGGRRAHRALARDHPSLTGEPPQDRRARLLPDGEPGPSRCPTSSRRVRKWLPGRPLPHSRGWWRPDTHPACPVRRRGGCARPRLCSPRLCSRAAVLAAACPPGQHETPHPVTGRGLGVGVAGQRGSAWGLHDEHGHVGIEDEALRH